MSVYFARRNSHQAPHNSPKRGNIARAFLLRTPTHDYASHEPIDEPTDGTDINTSRLHITTRDTAEDTRYPAAALTLHHSADLGKPYHKHIPQQRHRGIAPVHTNQDVEQRPLNGRHATERHPVIAFTHRSSEWPCTSHSSLATIHATAMIRHPQDSRWNGGSDQLKALQHTEHSSEFRFMQEIRRAPASWHSELIAGAAQPNIQTHSSHS